MSESVEGRLLNTQAFRTSSFNNALYGVKFGVYNKSLEPEQLAFVFFDDKFISFPNLNIINYLVK